MEILTKRVDGIAVLESWAIDKDPVSIIQRLCNRLAAYEDTGLTPEDMAHWMDYFRAECEDRLVVLPCKAGSLIYVGRKPAIITRFFGYVRERYFYAVFCDENKGIDIPFEELGKTVFLTREEAEAAMALKGGTNEDSCGL